MSIVSIDLETELIDRCKLAPPIICVGIATGGVVCVQRWPWQAVEYHLRCDTLIGANFAFDAACIMADDPEMIGPVFAAYREGRVHDVLLQEKMLDIASDTEQHSYSLEAVAGRHGHNKHSDNPWRLEYTKLKQVPIESWPKGAVDYVINDALVPLNIYDGQLMAAQKWPRIFERTGEESYAALAFYLASCWGVRTSARRVGALELAIQKRIEAARGRLVSIGLVRPETKLDRNGHTVPNPEAGTRDTKNAAALIESAWKASGLPPKRTDTGRFSLDEDACIMSGSEDLILYAEYGQAGTTLARVEDLKQGVALPLQARFNTLLNTYRTSSSKPRPPVMGIQMQNFGKTDGTRETLEPREGRVFLVSDVTAMEAHFWAQYCIDMGWGSTLGDMLNAGVDIHRRLASMVLGKPDDAITKEERDLMKPGNYGFMGGMGVDTFILTQRKDSGITYTAEFAGKLREAWLKMTAPASTKFFGHINKLCRTPSDKGTLQHPRTGAWRTAHYCALANFTFQHPSAIGVKRALCQSQYEAYVDKTSPLYGARLVNAIHDEAVYECLEARAADGAERLGTIMAEGVNSLLPDVPTTAPPLVTRVWSKKAKAIRNPQGLLVPYELPI